MMKCRACGCRDRWVSEEICPVENHPNVEIKIKICACGFEQEDFS